MYEQLSVRHCSTASLIIAFTVKEQSMWGKGIAQTMLITLSGHINLVELTLDMLDQRSVLLGGANHVGLHSEEL